MHRSFFRSLVVAVGLALAGAESSMARTQIPNAVQPQLTASADGRVWLVYGQVGAAPAPRAQGDHSAHGGGDHKGHGGGPTARPEGEIFVACSKDGGATFAPAVKVATVPSIMLGMRRGPRIVAHGDDVTLTVTGPLQVRPASEERNARSSPLLTNHGAVP